MDTGKSFHYVVVATFRYFVAEIIFILIIELLITHDKLERISTFIEVIEENGFVLLPEKGCFNRSH